MKRVILSATKRTPKPKYWNTQFACKVIDAYNQGNLTLSNIVEWETDYNDGVRPNPSLGTKPILEYYIQTRQDPRDDQSR